MARLTKVLGLWPWLAAVVSGLLYAACFAPFNYDWLCWIALIPLLAAIWFSGQRSKRRWARDILLGYVAGLSFFWTVFSWLQTVTVPGWLLVGAYMSLYLALWSWLCGLLRPRPRPLRERPIEGLEAVNRRLNEKYAVRRVSSEPAVGAALSGAADDASAERRGYSAEVDRRSPWLSSINNLRLALLLAAAWVGQEWLRSIVFSGWGWNTLGHALHRQLVLIQIAEFTGVAGLSFMVAFTNVILLASVRRFILETRIKPMRPHFDLTLSMAAIVGVMSFGVHALRVHRDGKPLNVALVQPNVPREEKFSVEFASKTFDQFTRLSRPALETNVRADLLVWPESAMPGPVLGDERSYRFVMDFSAAAKTDLLLGTIDQDETHAYNAAMLVSDGGAHTQIYRKVHLVPFGEYVPGRHTIPLLARVVGDQVPDDFSFGKEYTVFKLTNEKAIAAPLICFEDTIGDLARQFVRAGANLLVNVTNDGWFLRSAGSQQHLANAVFRCVETRLPMVRAANTGVTCFVNEFGNITQTLVDEAGSQFTEGTLTGQVMIVARPDLTFYVRHGELVAHSCVALMALTFLFAAVRAVIRRRRHPVESLSPLSE
ncbi:MAG TPA: apolipoprotein N-acyltransferase [Chthoniobacterales bacterium]|nr:apolipoprotein N-acyltransferase [Chthoniobacterales bacterium]